MLTVPRDPSTVDPLQELLDGIFTARDELYAASDLLVDADECYICRWLADRLGGHAADLQQILTASGVGPVDTVSEREAETGIALLPSKDDDRIVLAAAEQIERALAERYDGAIRKVADQEIVGLLGRQREEAAFADCVLRRLNVSGEQRPSEA